MPSYYRGINDDSYLWRNDSGGPAKKPKTTNYDSTANDGDLVEAIKEDCIYEDGICISISGNSSDNGMVTDDGEMSGETVDEIMSMYFEKVVAVSSAVDIHDAKEQLFTLKKGLGKLLHLVGDKQRNHVIKQQNRMKALQLGCHWTLSTILKSLVGIKKQNHHKRTFFGLREPTNSTGINIDDTNSNGTVFDVVSGSVKVLSELLLADPSAATVEDCSNVDTPSKIKYQVYCAGGLDCVLLAMIRFNTSYDVQLHGCKFLSNLITPTSLPSSSFSYTDNDVCSLGGCSAIADDFYRSTNGLDVIIKTIHALIAGRNFVVYDQNSTEDTASVATPTVIGTEQLYCLFFTVTDFLKKFIQISDPRSGRRSELISSVKKANAIGNGDALRCLNINSKAENNRGLVSGSTTDTSMTMTGILMDGNEVEEFHNDWVYGHSKGKTPGLGKHLYTHIMSVLLEEDYTDSNFYDCENESSMEL